MNSRILRAVLASLAGLGICFCLFILYVLFLFEFRAQPLSYAIVYAIVVVGVVFVFSSKQTVLIRAGFTSVGVAALLVLSYSRSGLSLYVLTTALGRTAIAVGALFLAWALLRHVVLYYKNLLMHG
jgi:hypothetical protein